MRAEVKIYTILAFFNARPTLALQPVLYIRYCSHSVSYSTVMDVSALDTDRAESTSDRKESI